MYLAVHAADICQLYRCLADGTRLRILNVLVDGPLCVCHLQQVLAEPQVKISKHLASLRSHGLVECERNGNWMIYRIAADPDPLLEQNLECLKGLRAKNPTFRADLKRLRQIDTSPACC